MQWLMYQMSHVGPIIGQAGHFVNQAPEKIPYAIQRFISESVRIIGVLEVGLEGREFLAGDYSIADIATYPWVQAAWGPFQSMMPEKVGGVRERQALARHHGGAPGSATRDGGAGGLTSYRRSVWRLTL